MVKLFKNFLTKSLAMLLMIPVFQAFTAVEASAQGGVKFRVLLKTPKGLSSAR